MHTAISGVPISCSPDIITPQGELKDYKFPALQDGVPSYNYPWPGHTAQLMFNAYIVRHADEVEGMYVIDHGNVRPAQLRDIPPITAVVLEYMGPKRPKPLTWEKKQDHIITKGPRAGMKVEMSKPYVWSDEEALHGLKIGNRFQPGLIELVETMQEALDAYPQMPERAAALWGGGRDWRCPGEPYCKLPKCLAKRYPNALTWDKAGPPKKRRGA
jgi:hypothetical protein